VLQDQPRIWASIDQRLRALVATDDLIARVDGSGLRHQGTCCSPNSDLTAMFDLPWTASRLFLPAKLAVRPCIDISRTRHQRRKVRRIFFGARAVAGVVVGVRRSPQHWPGTRPRVLRSPASGRPDSGPSCSTRQLTPFDGKSEITFLKTGVHCTMQCRIPLAVSGWARWSLGVSRYFRDFVDPFLNDKSQRFAPNWPAPPPCHRVSRCRLTKTTRAFVRLRSHAKPR